MEQNVDFLNTDNNTHNNGHLDHDNQFESLDEYNFKQETLEEATERIEPNNYSSLYKKPGGLPDQSKRREDLLKEQKSRRNKLTDEARGLFKDGELKMEHDTVKTNHRYKYKKYRNKIMLSEWFIDVPEDLDISWFLKVCPSGHRCLVVALKNSTKSFSKNGDFETEFKSVLPGANPSENIQKGTILDCIWVPKIRIFYVLDVLMWAGQDLTDYDAEFRFFWLQSKMHELEELRVKSSNNNYPFFYVSHTAADYPSILDGFETFTKYPNDIPVIDGALFYHREASYSAGKTPLVGWLKPYMIPEILNIPVATEYINLRPQKYGSLRQHIDYAKTCKKNKKMNTEEMETEVLENT